MTILFAYYSRNTTFPPSGLRIKPKNPITLDGLEGGDIKFIGKQLNHIAETARTGDDAKKIGSLYGFDVLVKSEASKKDGFDMIQNRFYVRGEGNYLYSFNHGNLAADPRLAAQNFINVLGTIEPTLEKFRKENEKLSMDIPVLKEVVEGTWRKEPELSTLKNEMVALERKIQLSLKPVEQDELQDAAQENKGMDSPETENYRNPLPNVPESPDTPNNRQIHVPDRLWDIAVRSDGHIMIVRPGAGKRLEPDNPLPPKGIKM